MFLFIRLVIVSSVELEKCLEIYILFFILVLLNKIFVRMWSYKRVKGLIILIVKEDEIVGNIMVKYIVVLCVRKFYYCSFFVLFFF